MLIPSGQRMALTSKTPIVYTHIAKDAADKTRPGNPALNNPYQRHSTAESFAGGDGDKMKNVKPIECVSSHIDIS